MVGSLLAWNSLLTYCEDLFMSRDLEPPDVKLVSTHESHHYGGLSDRCFT